MKIEILKKPKDLNRDELSGIFKKATGFDFQEFCVKDFVINNNGGVVPLSIYCKFTGYSMYVYNDYKIEVQNTVAPLSGRMDVIGVLDVLLNFGIIKIKE